MIDLDFGKNPDGEDAVGTHAFPVSGVSREQIRVPPKKLDICLS